MQQALWKFFVLTLSSLFAKGEIVLNEIYSNDTSGEFSAADGGHYDWIELHNSGDTEVNLQGYFLTDQQWAPTKWKFPRSFVLPAGGYRIVFASDLDDLVSEQEHLNFKLSSGGEYLALIDPDGLTVVDEFSPSFPVTDPRVTYGRPDDTASPSLLAEPTPGKTNSGAPLFPSIESFQVTPNPATSGTLVTVSWNTSNAEKTTINGIEVEKPSGSFQFRANHMKTFSLVSSSRFGTTENKIHFEALEAPLSFSARPTILASGGMSVVRWHTPSAENPDTATLNGQVFSAKNSRLLIHPTNDTIMPQEGRWLTASQLPPDDWNSLEYDDSNWLESGPPSGIGYFRRKFDIPDLDRLSSAILQLDTLSVSPSVSIWLNGLKLTHLPDSNSLERSGHIWSIPIDLLHTQGNLLAIQTSFYSSTPKLPFEINAWQSLPINTIYPLELVRTIDGEEVSETIELTILAKDAAILPSPQLAISEFFPGIFFVDFPGTELKFIEIANRSQSSIDLQGVQLAGLLYHDFSRAEEAILRPQQFGLVVRDQLLFSIGKPTGLPIIGVSEGPVSDIPFLRSIETPNGKPVILIDQFGRIIEISPPTNDQFIFDTATERVNFSGRAQNSENWHTGGSGCCFISPGEDRLIIEEFTASPEAAQHGDWVTLSWRVSRPVDLLISNGVGNVSGANGSVRAQLRDDRATHSYRLTATSEFMVQDKWIHVTTPPVIRYFESSARVIHPYQPVTFYWGGSLDAPSLSSEPGLRIGYPSEFSFIAGASGFGRGERWSYLPSDREFQPAWKAIAHPSGFSAAETPLGVNRPGVRRVLPSGTADQAASHFRKNFTLENIEEIERLFIDILAEDGAAVYLNGIEVLRINLPDGEISQTTQALSDRSTGNLIYEEFELDRSFLQDGENVIAISLHLFHEVGALPVDQAFDLALRAERTLPGDGRLRYTLSSTNDAGRDEATMTLIIGETKTLEEWQREHSLTGEASLADADNDGVSDLLEFVTGTDPLNSTSLPLSVEWTPAGQLEISFRQELTAIGYQLQLEESSDLEKWCKINYCSSGYYYLDDKFPENSTLALRKYRSIGTMPGGPKYFRLRAFKQEP